VRKKLIQTALWKEVDRTKSDLSVAEGLSSGSGVRLWWRCKKGHSWEAAVYSRKKSGCPYCAGKRVTKKESFGFKHPDLVIEWGSSNKLSPYSVSEHSNRRAWWRCRRCGREWQAAVKDRSHGKGCSACSGRHISKIEVRFFCEISLLCPDVVMGYRVGRWKCDLFVPSLSLVIEVDGARWHKDMGRDVRKNTALGDAGLSVLRARGIPLKAIVPMDVSFDESTGKGVDRGIRSVVERLVGMGVDEKGYLSTCGFQNDGMYAKMLRMFPVTEGDRVFDRRPELASEWDYYRNAENPNFLSYGSKRKVWWRCSRGHSWMDSPYRRVVGKSDCHYCSGRKVGTDNNLLVLCPSLSFEWDMDKNDFGPDEITPSSNRKVWWLCGNGHSWMASPNNRTKGKGCPYCSGRKPRGEYNLVTEFPLIAAEWSKANGKEASEFLPKSNKMAWWVCHSCGHEWDAIIANRTRGSRCPVCHR